MHRSTADIRFPKALGPGSRIGITAPSSGVRSACHARLDRVLENVRRLGFEPIEGRCLRTNDLEESAPASDRAAELMDFLTRPDIDAVIPPWGGGRAIELLSKLDFERLREAAPRWVLGFSDISTILVPLLLRAGWASAHGPQLMDLPPNETDEHTTAVWRVLQGALDPVFEQRSSWHHLSEHGHGNIEHDPDATFHFTEPTQWHELRPRPSADADLRFEGRLVGGCLDTMKHLVGTPFGDVRGYVARHANDGVILFLENVEHAPPALLRALTQLRLGGWLDGLRGLLLGRSLYRARGGDGDMTYRHALEAVLGDLPYPVVFDVDIGHVPPQLTLVEGALATVTCTHDGWRVSQRMA